MSAVLHDVGHARERSEDERFLRGAGCFIDDFKLPGLCHAVIVRSAMAHGRIAAIDTAAALACPAYWRSSPHARLAALGRRRFR